MLPLRACIVGFALQTSFVFDYLNVLFFRIGASWKDLFVPGSGLRPTSGAVSSRKNQEVSFELADLGWCTTSYKKRP